MARDYRTVTNQSRMIGAPWAQWRRNYLDPERGSESAARRKSRRRDKRREFRALKKKERREAMFND